MTAYTKNKDVIDDFVNVAIRVRPNWRQRKSKPNSSMNVIKNNPPVLLVIDRGQSYSFDHIFPEDSTQLDVYGQMIEPLIDKVMSGYNCTVFAYGQTGTGKTYTMGSDLKNIGDDAGIIIRSFDTIFNKHREDRAIEVSVSFYEIYNEKVYDLLSENKAALSVKGFSINNLKKAAVFDISEANHMLLVAVKNRHTGETKQNLMSSRSHAVFTIYCKVKDENDEVEAKLNLVDLAGSESVKKTGTEGFQFHEGVNINKGLLSIGQVINALSSNRAHIPYRQSMITTILQDSLNKKNYVTLVACVSPNSDDVHESVQTLEFAQRAKKLKSKPELNNIVTQYTKDNPAVLEVMNSARKTKVVNSKYQTPFKRPRLFQTSTVAKRPKQLSSTLLGPIDSEITACRDTSISDISSLSSIHDGPNLSPIVKKCVDAIETSVMAKLENFISKAFNKSPQVTNKIGFSWNELHLTVSQLVRDEVRLNQRQNSKESSHISPIMHINQRPGKLIFDEDPPPPSRLSDNLSPTIVDSPLALQNISKTIIEKFRTLDPLAIHEDVFDDPPTFKLPQGVPKKRKGTPSSMVSSPKRRSTRLSLKRLAVTEEAVESPPSPILTTRASIVRRRLTLPKSNVENISCQPRRSVRLSVKGKTPPKPAPRKLLSVPTPMPRKDEAISHSRHILRIVNGGDVKAIRKLHTIGVKTAEKIILYRQLKGNYKKISDLKNVLSNGRIYERFLESNFLDTNV